MDYPQLNDLSDQAQVWIYAFPKALTAPEEAIVVEALDCFTSRWRSHGEAVRSGWVLIDGCLVVLAGEVPGGTISGCGIDASVRCLKALKETHGLDAMGSRLIYFRDGAGKPAAVTRAEFQGLVSSGAVGPDTEVYDLTVESLGKLRREGLVRPFRESWHANAFR